MSAMEEIKQVGETLRSLTQKITELLNQEKRARAERFLLEAEAALELDKLRELQSTITSIVGDYNAKVDVTPVRPPEVTVPSEPPVQAYLEPVPTQSPIETQTVDSAEPTVQLEPTSTPDPTPMLDAMVGGAEAQPETNPTVEETPAKGTRKTGQKLPNVANRVLGALGAGNLSQEDVKTLAVQIYGEEDKTGLKKLTSTLFNLKSKGKAHQLESGEWVRVATTEEAVAAELPGEPVQSTSDEYVLSI